MAVPAATRKLIEARAIKHAFVNLDEVHECEGSRFHSPTPLETHPYRVARSGIRRITPDGTEVWLCGTCVDNLTFYVRLQAQTNNDLPWEVRREFGNLIRALGDNAWVRES